MAKSKDFRVNIITDIKKGRISSDKIHGLFKYQVSQNDRDYILSKLDKRYYDIIYCTPLPKSDDAIGRNSSIIVDTPSLFNELKWTLELVVKYYKEINNYLALSDLIEVSILNNRYEDFFEHLEKLESNVCHSLYGIMSEMLVNDSLNPEENTIILEELESLNTSIKIVISLEHTKFRVDRKMPSWQYDSLVAEHKKNYGVEFSEFLDYIDFKFDPSWENNNKQLGSLPFITSFESDFSIIDRYNSLKNIIPVILQQNELSEKEVDELLDLSDKINTLVEDSFWSKLFLIRDPLLKMNPTNRSKFYYQIQDLYLDEKYDELINISRMVFKDNPNYSESYLFFVKAIILKGYSLSSYIDEGTEIYNILELLKSILEKGKNYISDRDKLLNFYYNFSHFSFSYSLKEFLFNEYNVSIPPNVVYSSLFNIEPIRYNFCNTYNSINRQQTNIVFKNPLISELKVYNSINEFYGNTFKNTNTLFYAQLKIDFLINTAQYFQALIDLNNLHNTTTSSNTNSAFVETWIVRKFLECYLRTKQYSEMANLIVECYFNQKVAYNHYFSDQIVDHICNDESENFLKNISIPILFHIYNQSQAIMYDSVANFLVAYSLEKPSEFIDASSDLDLEKRIYFFEKICIKENIEDSPFINTIEELENERILILNHLKLINTIKIDDYNDEILRITKESSIRQGLKQIHESRIYVDTKNITKIIEAELDEFFIRYLDLNDITIADITTMKLNQQFHKERKKLIYYFIEPIDDAFYPFYTFKNDPHNDPNVMLVPQLRYIYFVTLFEHIRNLFVFHESYGFRGFLSMRIRHGTFSNVLRSIFDKHKIVSSMEPNSLQYQNVKYWETKFIGDANSHEELQKHLKKFSEEIDQQIEEGLSWINVQNKVNPSANAIFNFDFDNEELMQIFQNKLGRITKFDEFIVAIFDILYNRLELRLNLLREKIYGQLTAKLIRTIDDLHKNIKLISFRPQEDSLLVQEIVSCRTEIQQITSQISNWFKVSYNSYIEKFTIDLILKVSLNYIDVINTSAISKGNVTIKNDCDIKFNGKYFESFGDMFINLFDNIVSKNKDLENDLKINIEIINDNESISIKVINNLSENISSEDISLAIAIINEKVSTYEDSSPVDFEKGSGYLKICRAISTGLQLKNYIITPKYIERNFEVTIKFNFKELIV